MHAITPRRTHATAVPCLSGRCIHWILVLNSKTSTTGSIGSSSVVVAVVAWQFMIEKLSTNSLEVQHSSFW